MECWTKPLYPEGPRPQPPGFHTSLRTGCLPRQTGGPVLALASIPHIPPHSIVFVKIVFYHCVMFYDMMWSMRLLLPAPPPPPPPPTRRCTAWETRGAYALIKYTLVYIVNNATYRVNNCFLVIYSYDRKQTVF